MYLCDKISKLLPKKEETMKKLLLIALAVMCAGVVSCGSKESPGHKATTSDSTSSSTAYTGKIVFIKMDSLMSQFGMYIDMSDEFTKKSQSVQNELMNKGRSLESEGKQLEENYQKGQLTRYQVESKAQELQKRQQDVMAYRDSKLNELQQQEAQMSKNISDVIKSYLEELNKERGYSMILQTMGGNPVVIADPSLDITREVVDVLNSRYKASLEKK